jgi:hypothetical protein
MAGVLAYLFPGYTEAIDNRRHVWPHDVFQRKFIAYQDLAQYPERTKWLLAADVISKKKTEKIGDIRLNRGFCGVYRYNYYEFRLFRLPGEITSPK